MWFFKKHYKQIEYSDLMLTIHIALLLSLPLVASDIVEDKCGRIVWSLNPKTNVLTGFLVYFISFIVTNGASLCRQQRVCAMPLWRARTCRITRRQTALARGRAVCARRVSRASSATRRSCRSRSTIRQSFGSPCLIKSTATGIGRPTSISQLRMSAARDVNVLLGGFFFQLPNLAVLLQGTGTVSALAQYAYPQIDERVSIYIFLLCTEETRK